jgi:uncharacterized membrane protein
MRVLNIAVTIALVFSGTGLVGGLIWHQGGLAAASVVVGTMAITCALTIALVLGVVLLYRTLSGTARPLLERSWLGLLNGAISATVWALFVWRYGS